MDKLIIIGLLIGKLTITSYRSIPAQTDSSPLYTSTNKHVYKGGCAVSRDLLCKACRRLHHRCQHPDDGRFVHYGDYLYIEGYGIKQVNDIMGPSQHYWIRTKQGKRKLFVPIRQALDIWVSSYQEEKAINVKYKMVYKLDIQ